MKAIAVSGSLTGGAVPFTLLSLLATATRRVKLLQVVIGCSDGTPVDAGAQFAIKYITTDGTGTANTTGIGAVDSADGAPTITSKQNYTAEPTYDATRSISIPLHNRNTVVWNAPNPDAPPASNLSGGTVKGIGIVEVSGPLKQYNVTVVFDE